MPASARPPLAAAIAAVTLAAVAGACSFIVDFPECRTHADCVGADEPRACSEANTCVTAEEFADCSSSQVCADAFGDDFLCGRTSRCISAVTEVCPRVYWPEGEGLSRDEVVIVGSMIPVSPPYDAIAVPLENAVRLAIEDFNQTVSLPGGRKIAWIACDDRGIADVGVDAARHLVDEVGVPAIVGPLFSEVVLQVAQEVTIPGETLMISPTASSKEITDLEDQGLVWRTIPSDVYQAAGLRDRILADLEPRPNRLVILAKDDAYGDGIVSDTAAAIVGGGVEVSVQRYADPTSFASQEALLSAYGGVIAGAFGADPDAVMLVGTSEVANLIGLYIKTWSDLTPGAELPRFILSHGGVPVMETAVNQFDPALRPLLMGLLEGTSPVIQDPENFASYNIRYKIRFDDQDALTTSSLSYDATLVVLLAMVTIPEGEPITGPGIASGIARLTDPEAPRVNFRGGDLTFLRDSVDALVSGANVDLQGVSGALDFDLATGEVRTDIVGWDLRPRAGTTDVPVLTPARTYVLDPLPATSGTWYPIPGA